MDASEIGLQEFDHQQALVLAVLRRAGGAPVSYAELRGAGVDLPASVVSELELAGVGIERCGAGVRLDPAEARAPRPTQPPPEPAPVRGRAGRRVVAVTGLLAAVAVVASLVVISLAGAGHHPRAPAAARTRPRVTVASTSAPTSSRPRPTHQAPPVPVSPALATELEAQGHDLLQAGNYGAAVPVLRRAVLATGENLGACLEPASTTCLTYAYALYDLGRAVRLNGEPQAAVPILERRLQIDNQRWVVSDELQLARQGVG